MTTPALFKMKGTMTVQLECDLGVDTFTATVGLDDEPGNETEHAIIDLLAERIKQKFNAAYAEEGRF